MKDLVAEVGALISRKKPFAHVCFLILIEWFLQFGVTINFLNLR